MITLVLFQLFLVFSPTDDDNDSDDDDDDDYDDDDEENGPETAETESEVNAQPSNTPTDINNNNDKETNVVFTSSTNEGDTLTSDSLQPDQPASPTEASEPSPTSVSDKHEEL